MANARDLKGLKIFKPQKYKKQLYEDSHKGIFFMIYQ